MRITETRLGDVVVMDLAGRFMAGDDLERLRQRIKTLAGTGVTGVTGVLLDLAAVTFIDSTAIGLLVSAHTTLTRAGGALRVCCLSDHVHHVLCVCHLENVLATHPSRDAALAAFRARTLQPGDRRRAAEESA